MQKNSTLANRAIPLLCAAACGLALAMPAAAQTTASTPGAAPPAKPAPGAQQQRPAGKRSLDERLQGICAAADRDHDGNVSLDEFHQDIVQSWHSLGPDASGHVVLAELAQVPGMGKGRTRRLAAADKDGDGKLSFKEVVETRMAYFEAADADSNDLLSVPECVAYEKQRRKSKQ
jgi:Ca2+-binding EF-hand superfamily protein